MRTIEDEDNEKEDSMSKKSADGTAGSVRRPTLFPEHFLWGASSSAFQIEGGWDEGKKGMTVADYISCGCMENGDARLTPGFQYLKGIGADLFGMVAGKWMTFTHPCPCHVHGGDGRRLSKSHLAHETTLFIDFTCLSKCLFKKFLIKLIMVHKLIILIFCHVVCTFFLGA